MGSKSSDIDVIGDLPTARLSGRKSSGPRSAWQTPKVLLDLQISVIRGRNLVAKDRNFITRRKSSDAYVMVYFGGRFCGQTNVIRKNLNPKWMKTISIKVDANDSVRYIDGNPDFTNILLRIWDEDKLSADDFMGEVKIPLNLEEDLSQSWHRVATGDQNNPEHYCHNATGDIEVRIMVTNRKGLKLEKERPFIIPFERFLVTINWKIESGQVIDLENSCVAIGRDGNVLIDESVYFAQMTNPTGSVCRSDENLFGGRFETVFHFNQNSVPLWVRAFYFITTVALRGKTLMDLESITVKVSDPDASETERHYKPNISEDHTAMFLMRISRDQSHKWCLRIIEDWNHTARDFGTLIPQMKEYSRDMNPDIKVNPKELIAIMRPGMSIHIKDYANGAGADKLVFALGWDTANEEDADLDTFVICLDASNDPVEIVSNKNTRSSDGSIELSHISDGDEDEDNARILMNLDDIPSNITNVGVAITSRSGQKIDYNKVKCRLYNKDPDTEMDLDSKRDTEMNLASYQISNDPSFNGYPSLMLACFYRESSDWNIRILGKAMVTTDIVEDLQRFICDVPASQPDVVRVNPLLSRSMNNNA